MSKRTGVLADNQLATDRVTTHVPREVADLLVSRLVAERLSQRLIRMLPQDAESAFRCLKVTEVQGPPRPYIPEKMPPRDVPGVWFQEPQTEQWQIQHRTVTFFQEV